MKVSRNVRLHISGSNRDLHTVKKLKHVQYVHYGLSLLLIHVESKGELKQDAKTSIKKSQVAASHNNAVSRK